MTAGAIDVEETVGKQSLRAFHVILIALLTLIAMTDGFDLQSAALAAPGIARAWGVDRAALTPMLSAGFVGILVGAPALGWLGDKFGRKPAIIAGCAIYGAACIACAFAPSLDILTSLRVVVGIGLGGVLPNVFALAAELAPARQRAAFTAIVALGIIVGSAGVSMLAGVLGPAAWRDLFLIGGALGLVAALGALTLPESPLFLATRGAHEKLARLMRKIAPDTPDGASFAVRAPDGAAPGLFSGGFALVTPLIWTIYICSLLTIFFVTSWAPVVLQAEGIPPDRAAAIVSLFQIGGIAGSIAASFFLRALRFSAVAILLGMAVICVLVVALNKLGDTQLAIAVAACGFAILGAQTALNAASSLLYPSALRARGVGWGLGVGRIGSIAGPLIGGALIAADALSAQRLFLAPAAPLTIALIAAVFVARWQRRNG